MIVSIHGELTGDQRLERGLQLFVEKWAPVVLEGTRVNEVKLCFRKDRFNFKNGFKVLTCYDVVHLVIPKNYRGHWRSRWLVIHDLCHAVQQLEKRLGKSTQRVFYAPPKKLGPKGVYIKIKGGRGAFKAPNGEVMGPIWEDEVNRLMMPKYLGKRFHKQLRDRAWP